MENVTVNRFRFDLTFGIMGILALLQLLDFSSTYAALAAGGMEANPIARGLIETGWWVFFLVKALMAAMFVALVPMLRTLIGWQRHVATGTMGMFGLFMTAVVINNYALV